METISIKGLGLAASRIGLGTWAIGGWMWGGTDEQEAIRTIHAALDRGITLIDTAPVYGFGQAEEIVGKALSTAGARHRAIVATKVGLDWQDGKVFRNSSPTRIVEEIDASLRRLKTDVIDIYQVHWPDSRVPLHETASAIERLRRAGKIRAVGVSNFTPRQIELFGKYTPVATVQPPLNLFERDAERDVLPFARSHKLTVLAYGALCRGLLSGKMKASTRFEGDDLRRNDPKFQPPRFAQYLAAVAELDRFARAEFGKSVLALAVRWVLDQGPTVALWGARKPQQLEAVDEAMGWKLTPDAKQEIERILQAHVHDAIGPQFMAPPIRARAA
ncbi:MAG TPA: aldo/keto reductase [Alphaproteobacteria bacterium]